MIYESGGRQQIKVMCEIKEMYDAKKKQFNIIERAFSCVFIKKYKKKSYNKHKTRKEMD